LQGFDTDPGTQSFTDCVPSSMPKIGLSAQAGQVRQRLRRIALDKTAAE
jgi:hypothetical protein